MTLTPRFKAYRWIVVNSSGGKDSQTALRYVVQEAQRQGYDRSQIVVSHQDLGEMEWKGTIDLARKQAQFYGLRFIVSKYRTAQKEEIDLLEKVRRRGKWPSSTNRYCTSDMKRCPGYRVVTALFRESSWRCPLCAWIPRRGEPSTRQMEPF